MCQKTIWDNLDMKWFKPTWCPRLKTDSCLNSMGTTSFIFAQSRQELDKSSSKVRRTVQAICQALFLLNVRRAMSYIFALRTGKSEAWFNLGIGGTWVQTSLKLLNNTAGYHSKWICHNCLEQSMREIDWSYSSMKQLRREIRQSNSLMRHQKHSRNNFKDRVNAVTSLSLPS